MRDKDWAMVDDSVKHPSTFLVIKRRRTTSGGRSKWKTSRHEDVHRAVSPCSDVAYANNPRMHNPLRNVSIQPRVGFRREFEALQAGYSSERWGAIATINPVN